ncbi:rRNA-processing protein cgrA [Cyphellophora attinorum]|uniref:rRNA-processing protein n=1 Tax=Cyphellophora attinorum TaxID=1664694 RepID=A0A0N1GZ56_9EURO|nr:rRNA-processing protein cgrA [Phialophora attinorum]KPI36213.1 rRNA-processing protein cgrA [Phialophora attinorum]
MSNTISEAAPAPAPPSDTASKQAGLRKNGKQWHTTKKPFRPTAGMTAYAQRKTRDQEKAATKALEQEMRDEKEAERNRRIQVIKDRRKAKEEKERYEKMAEKMHQKRVERRKRREKRNKLLNS